MKNISIFNLKNFFIRFFLKKKKNINNFINYILLIINPKIITKKLYYSKNLYKT